MGIKVKQVVGLGCIAAGLAIGNANAECGFFCGGDCYLGGSFGKAFTGKKITGKHIPIAHDVGLADEGDTQDLSYKKGNAFSVFFGTKKDNIRYQIELSSLETKHKDTWDNNETGGGGRLDLSPMSSEHTKALSIMPQIFYDFSISKAENLIPYFGAGLGYSKVKEHWINGNLNFEETQKQNKLAGQLIAGVRYKFTDNLAASLDYKYFRVLGKLKALDASYYNHSVQVGLVVNI